MVEWGSVDFITVKEPALECFHRGYVSDTNTYWNAAYLYFKLKEDYSNVQLENGNIL